MDTFDLRLWAGFKEAGGELSTAAIIDQVTIDSRRIDSKNALFVALEGQVEDGHQYISQAANAGAKYILAKKGWTSSEKVTAKVLFVESTLHALQQIAGAYRLEMPCTVIAIAGSHGKTMVKDLLLQMLEKKLSAVASPESFNSQIGVPLSLLTIRKHHEIAIIEAAISKKNEMAHLSRIIAPDFGIVTHIGKKHISTLGSLNTVACETAKILHPLTKGQWAVIPKDPHILDCLTEVKAHFHYWTESSENLPHATYTTLTCEKVVPYRVDFPDGSCYEGMTTSGFYYFLDLVNITVKAAWLLGITKESIGAVLSKYHPEPVRIEIWKSPLGSTFINETYCSDPQSVEKSIKHFRQADAHARRVFIFGGMRGKRQHELSDYRSIGREIRRNRIATLILFGPHNFSSLIDEVTGGQTKIISYKTSEEALSSFKAEQSPNDVVLIKGDNKLSLDSITSVFDDGIYSNQCIINLAAIANNIEAIRCKVSLNTRIMVMVKALAYGTDEIRMAKFLETCGIDILGVSYVDEAVALKRSGVKQQIFVINAAPYEASKIVKWDLEVGVSDFSLIQAIEAIAGQFNKKIKLHLHVDTGMGRFGCRPEDALPLAKQILTSPHLTLEGIMTHFAAADEPAEDAFTLNQAKILRDVIERFNENGINPTWRHAANSAGALRFHFPEFNMIRIGLAVYGLHSSKATKETIDLRLALSLNTRIVGINVCKKGETISYSRSYKVEREKQHIAILPIGYFDGLHRNYSDKGFVNIRGQKAPMVGKICMDFMMVDVTDIEGAASGDPVLIFGEDEYGNYLSPEDLASSGDSIIHELITCLGPRIQRIFVYEEALRTH